jgi:hypothetical protein
MDFGLKGDLFVCGANSENVLRYHGRTGGFIQEFIPPGRGGLVVPATILFLPFEVPLSVDAWGLYR